MNTKSENVRGSRLGVGRWGQGVGKPEAIDLSAMLRTNCFLRTIIDRSAGTRQQHGSDGRGKCRKASACANHEGLDLHVTSVVR